MLFMIKKNHIYIRWSWKVLDIKEMVCFQAIFQSSVLAYHIVRECLEPSKITFVRLEV